MQTVLCAQCQKEVTVPPSKLARNKNHFCSLACSRQWQNRRVKFSCEYCHKEFLLPPSKARSAERHFCSPNCYYKSRQSWFSTYFYRDLESTPRQRLVRFLIAHGVGKVGEPGENVIIRAKNNFYSSEMMPHPDPMWALAEDLKELGHYKLSQMVEDGSWQDESKWPAYSENWFHRPQQLPWENRDDD